MENEPLPPRPERGHPAHGVHVQPDSPTIVFLTVCLQERRSLLAVPAVRQCLHQLWLERATAWLVSDYLLMPDHVPHAERDPGGLQSFAFCYGYISALIRAADQMA